MVNAGISGSGIRDIMLEAVERRFRALRAPAAIAMLTDNGPPYIAKDTQIFARQLGLKPCFTPVQSPQSNGISEAFVKTLKRDYVQVMSSDTHLYELRRHPVLRGAALCGHSDFRGGEHAPHP